MDNIESVMKEYLGQNLNKTEKTAYCLSEQALMDYFEHNLSREDGQNIENHLAGCRFCCSQLNLIFEAGDVYKRGKTPKVPVELIQRAKALLTTDKGTDHKKMLRKKRIKRKLFLIGAIMSFAASFFVPKYFCQFLVVTLILGIRWAFESEGGRTLIMVLDSWRRHSYNQDDEISQRLKDRFKTPHS